MSQGLLARACGICLICLVACVLLRQVRSELGAFVRVAGLLLVLGMLLPVFGGLRSSLGELLAVGDLEPYAEVMLRALGISLLCKLCADVCRDAGEGSLAGGVELAGKTVLVLLCLPLIEQILHYAGALLEEV